MKPSPCLPAYLPASSLPPQLLQDGYDQLGSLGEALRGRVRIQFIDAHGLVRTMGWLGWRRRLWCRRSAVGTAGLFVCMCARPGSASTRHALASTGGVREVLEVLLLVLLMVVVVVVVAG